MDLSDYCFFRNEEKSLFIEKLHLVTPHTVHGLVKGGKCGVAKLSKIHAGRPS
jgi:hypothetical protein